MGALKGARRRHAGERERVILAVGADSPPKGLLAHVGQLDGLVTEADARIATLSRDLAALAAPSDVEGLRAALLEFERVWDWLDCARCPLGHRRPVLCSVLPSVPSGV